VAAPVQRPPARRPVPVAADARRLRQCPRRTLDRPDTDRLDTDRLDTGRLDTDHRPDTDRGSGSGSGQPRRPRCPVPQPPGHRPRCPAAQPAAAGLRRTRSRPSRATAAPHVALARLRWSRGPGRRGRRIPAVRTRGHRPRPAGHREPARPRHCGHPRPRQGMRTLRQRPRWTAGSRPVRHRSHVRPEREPHCAAPASTRLTTRSVV
jgi:hypothetical protein